MAELLSPGVIIQEVPFGPQPIEGVSTSTAGFVGESLFGPSGGPPVLVTSWPDFERKFGGLSDGKTLGYAVRGFFENGGRRAFIARVSAEARATLTVRQRAGATGGALVPILGQLTSTGTANQYRMKLGSVVGLVYGTADSLTVLDRRSATAHEFNVNSIDPLTGVVTATLVTSPPPPPIPNLDGLSGERYYARFGAAGAADDLVTLQTRDPGEFGERLSLYITPTYGRRTNVRAQVDADHLELTDGTILRAGDRVQLDTGSARAVVHVDEVNPATGLVGLASSTSGSWADADARVVTWHFEVALDGVVVETLDGISSDPDRLADELEARSEWIRMSGSTNELDPANPAKYPSFARVLADTFSPVAAASVSDNDVVGTTTPQRTGIAALETQDQVSIIAAPGFTAQVVVNALITQAERLKDRFAVVDAPDSADVNDVLTDRGLYNSQYAAMYYPNVTVSDPLTGGRLSLSSSGHVVGAYARTDNDRGVYKAPANVVLRGILGFSRDVTDGEQDILNPLGVNVLRRLEGLGQVIWGARTMSADTLWKYVPVRRLFIFLEQSIARGTRYAVFEPNARPLWARIDDSVSDFLETQWRQGALFGERPEDAFFVRVDETTTTQTDRDNGVVNIEVGIAPAKPAEFVVFRIGQAPSSVIIAEQS